MELYLCGQNQNMYGKIKMVSKTLKDLEFMSNPPVIINGDCDDEFKFAKVKDLKREAMVHLKILFDNYLYHVKFRKRYPDLPEGKGELIIKEKIKWIINFFNITEEDMRLFFNNHF